MKKGILALVLAVCIPSFAQANEPEEITVYGVDLSERKAFQVALSTVVLIHKYNKEKDIWEFVEARDTSEKKEETES
tara:strand:+ start:162 stop:392 length:231 start_codon:yes stop_codon:yes gene_type:complete